ncbi:MAG: glycosyltransferase family 39 protein [Elusimicrobia bacterium]|nr:glycosyltransferase family 39 protein [Elusimicrobiota bacterium]
MIKRAAAWLSSERNYLLACAGLALLLRLVYVLKTGAGSLSPDAYDWMNTGWSVASGNGFGGSWRPPGYAFFLAAVFSVFGKSVIAAKVIQTILSAATVWICYRTAAELFDALTARITAALLAYYPYFIAYSADLLSETFLTFILAAAVYRVVRAAAAPSTRNLAFAGLLIGCAALTKSVVLPFFLLACAWLWWRTGRFRAGFLAGAFSLLVILPWSMRNYLHFSGGYVMPVSTPWFTLYGSACDEALLDENTGEIDKGPGVAEVNQFLPSDWNYVGSLPLPERDKYCKEKALSWIRNNPGKYAWLLYRRTLHLWRLYPVIAYRWQKWAAMATSGLYIPLAAAGFFLALPAFRKTSLLLALLVSYTAVYIPFAVTLRYRVPADPYFIMFAACALAEGWRRLRGLPPGESCAKKPLEEA